MAFCHQAVLVSTDASAVVVLGVVFGNRNCCDYLDCCDGRDGHDHWDGRDGRDSGDIGDSRGNFGRRGYMRRAIVHSGGI
eukprot:1165992-Amorphochlora_amoeboformis.AAC.2